MKIQSITLQNFKKFKNYEVICRPHNILIGRNNAGKSTILDALRIAHDVLRFAKRRNPNMEIFEGENCASFTVSPSLIRIPIQNIGNNYSDEDAFIRMKLENSAELVIILQSDLTVKAHLKSDLKIAKSTQAFSKQFPLSLVVVPTLGPVEENEQYLTDATISKSENTRTAHRHLRNILIRKPDEEFELFANEVSDGWPGISIEKPQVDMYNQTLQMLFIEKRIPREIFFSGFGFQVWMQMVLQFMRGTPETTLILDEPDIYLHPDFQVRLLEVSKRKFGQVFLATHSSAIINQADTGEKIIVSNEDKVSRRE
jgi:predicted ATP-dependent endonuclease of OLD family